METREQSSGADTGALGLTNFERFIAVVCWWQPFVALIALFFRSAPQSLKRHAKWSFVTAVVLVISSIALGLVLAAIGSLVGSAEAEAAGLSFAGTYGVLQGIAALINTVAIIANRGPYFRAVGGRSRSLR